MTCLTCGHSKKEHVPNVVRDMRKGKDFCYKCCRGRTHNADDSEIRGRWWHDFEDNLSYIERLAKEKGFI